MKDKNFEKTYFLPYQKRWLDDDAQIKIWEKSRRIGATFTQAYEDVRDIVTKRKYASVKPVERVYFSSKDEEAGKEYIEYCLKYAKVFNMAAKDAGVQIIDEQTGVKARILEFTNGGKIFALSSAPTAFNSKGGKIVWDEAALHRNQKEMWSGAHPAAMVWGYPIRILSTHKGKSTLFYRFCKNARERKNNFSLHRVTLTDALSEGLLDKTVGKKTTERERAEYVERIRAGCQDDDIFMQDYMAEPIDTTTAFITYDEIDAVENKEAPRTLEELAAANNALYAGWDIGRMRDLSVITIIEDLGGFLAVRLIEEFDRVKFSVQKEFLNKVMKLPSLRRICIDQTGMGLPLTEEARDKYGPYMVEGVTFTAHAKEIMAIDLRHQIEDRRLILPENGKLKESLHSVKRLVTAAGNIRYDAERTEQTGHADHFWSLALAIHAKTGGPSGPTWAASAGSPNTYDNFAGAVPFSFY